ncbi:MAG: MarR family transcriptional regulator, partial [Spirochaetes bacterium]|nr:MarR family transcriptional regulator [Spirochaetota bacterium]
MDKWTNINHRIQKQFGITLNEYAIANSIYHLSYPDGWCTAKKEYLGEHIGISKQSVFKILKNLIEYGLVEREKKSLRTTEKWNNAILETQASDPAIASNFSAKKCQKKVKKVDSESKESLLQKVKKVDSESKESLLQKVKKVDSESKESL